MSKTTRTRRRARSIGTAPTSGGDPMGVALMTASTSKPSALPQGTTSAESVRARRRAVASRRAARITWGSADGLDVDAVINATPVGSAPQVGAVPIDLARLRTRVVFDMVYYPLETRLLVEARSRGLIAISGLEMLVAQGARQFEIWTGKPAPFEEMFRTVLAALTARAAAAQAAAKKKKH